MRKYKFNDIHDMIALAKTVQTSIYWDMRFYYKEDDEYISYNNFWDYAEWATEYGYNAVTISDNNEVEFVRV